MAKEKTKISSSEDSIILGRDTFILNREEYVFDREEIPLIIELLKESHPTMLLTNYVTLSKLVKSEFDMEVPPHEFERYFSPSIEGLTDEYKYKYNML